MPAGRDDVSFSSEGVRCAAWLYRPGSVARPPVVVMAHGFAGTRELALPRYAERFASRGLAVLLFDYRHFGASEGTPRQLLSVARQLADWRAAVAFVRGHGELDGARVGLWGTSFSGGHVLVTAADDADVRAVVAQVPFVDGRARVATPPVAAAARLLGAALLDRARAALGLSPHYVRAVAPPGGFGVLDAPGAWEGYQSLIPPEGPGRWRNAVAARIALEVPGYRPVERAADVRCPLLLVAARRDELIPVASVEAVAARAPHARLEVVDARHFEVYTGETFARLAALEADFLVAQLASA